MYHLRQYIASRFHGLCAACLNIEHCELLWLCKYHFVCSSCLFTVCSVFTASCVQRRYLSSCFDVFVGFSEKYVSAISDSYERLSLFWRPIFLYSVVSSPAVVIHDGVSGISFLFFVLFEHVLVSISLTDYIWNNLYCFLASLQCVIRLLPFVLHDGFHFLSFMFCVLFVRIWVSAITPPYVNFILLWCLFTIARVITEIYLLWHWLFCPMNLFCSVYEHIGRSILHWWLDLIHVWILPSLQCDMRPLSVFFSYSAIFLAFVFHASG